MFEELYTFVADVFMESHVPVAQGQLVYFHSEYSQQSYACAVHKGCLLLVVVSSIACSLPSLPRAFLVRGACRKGTNPYVFFVPFKLDLAR